MTLWWVVSLVSYEAEHHKIWKLGLSSAVALLILSYPDQRFEAALYALNVRIGPTTRVIPWAAITSVRGSSWLFRGSLVIRYRGGGIAIFAPGDREQFLAGVISHCPQLSRLGKDLVMTPN